MSKKLWRVGVVLIALTAAACAPTQAIEARDDLKATSAAAADAASGASAEARKTEGMQQQIELDVRDVKKIQEFYRSTRVVKFE